MYSGQQKNTNPANSEPTTDRKQSWDRAVGGQNLQVPANHAKSCRHGSEGEVEAGCESNPGGVGALDFPLDPLVLVGWQDEATTLLKHMTALRIFDSGDSPGG
jgi:hypothetical protein